VSNSGLIRKITQIGIVTKDVKAMAERYEKVYGIGGWEFIGSDEGFPPEEKALNLTVHEKPQDYEIRLALAMVGDIQIELIQPLDELSDYAIYLNEHGEGVHHISIDTDIEAFHQAMKDRNIPTLITGTVPGKETFSYYDTKEEIGFTSEIHDTKNC
jgi:hypothetical protein